MKRNKVYHITSFIITCHDEFFAFGIEYDHRYDFAENLISYSKKTIQYPEI